jgi:hypothetical protein
MGVGEMSGNRILLFVFGLTIGFGTFAALGTAASVVMTQVQERVAPHAEPSRTSVAQMQYDRERVLR